MSFEEEEQLDPDQSSRYPQDLLLSSNSPLRTETSHDTSSKMAFWPFNLLCFRKKPESEGGQPNSDVLTSYISSNTTYIPPTVSEQYRPEPVPLYQTPAEIQA
ncbi:hypothetical protein FDECE_6648 [Fusarium decemcellulare]|nr:hypothetical protein FDECE_6648 [Fusarium decemcellulare]